MISESDSKKAFRRSDESASEMGGKCGKKSQLPVTSLLPLLLTKIGLKMDYAFWNTLKKTGTKEHQQW